MDPIVKSIIHTLAFYDAVGKLPLTKVELYKNLIRLQPASPELQRGELDDGHFPTFGELVTLLDHSWPDLKSCISEKRGFYFLKKNNDAYMRRIEMGKTSIKKWRIAKSMARIIAFLPYTKMVAVTGSLAHHATNKDSDIDILIVARGGHIWTTRMLVSAAMHLFGRRRHGEKVKDRICLNHYITDTRLALRPKHLFSAHICASFIPLWSKQQTDKLFLENNNELIKLYMPQLRKRFMNSKTLPERAGFPRRLALRHIVQGLASVAEFLSTKTVAKKVESLLKTLQINKIRSNITKGKAREDEVIFDDHALVFHHPRPQSQKALVLYEKNIKELGLAS